MDGLGRWTEIWRVQGGRPVALALDGAFWIAPPGRGLDPFSRRGRATPPRSGDGTRELAPCLLPAVDPRRPPRAGSVLALPIRPLDGLCAVLLPAAPQVARLDGRSLPTGPTVAAHGQRLEIGGHGCWFAVASQSTVVPYDPRRHGERRHCLHDATPLVPGEPVVTCPGTAHDECSGLRRRESSAPGSVCPSCGCDSEERRHRPLGPAFDLELGNSTAAGSRAPRARA